MLLLGAPPSWEKKDIKTFIQISPVYLFPFSVKENFRVAKKIVTPSSFLENHFCIRPRGSETNKSACD